MTNTKRSICSILLMLGSASVIMAPGTIDKDTQRNGMHSCPAGEFVLGVHVAQNLLICAPLAGDFNAEIVDKETQEQGMHACPAGMAMTGLHANKNLLACVPLTNPPPARFVDTGTQSMGMHACAGGAVVAGIQAAKNQLLCEDDSSMVEIEDGYTQRNGMHSCPPGRFISGVQIARNLLLCTKGALDSGEIVDNGTQSHGMHACPEHFVMTGVHASTNQLACTHLPNSFIPRVVDHGTQRQGMHACPPGQPLSGIHVDKNLNLCGDEYVMRVNSINVSQGSIRPGAGVTVSWNVVCTDPQCKVTLSGGAIGGTLQPGLYTASKIDKPNSGTTYTVTAAAGGGIDQKSVSVQIAQKSSFTFCLTDPTGNSSEITVNAYTLEEAAAQAQAKCGDCVIFPGGCDSALERMKKQESEQKRSAGEKPAKLIAWAIMPKTSNFPEIFQLRVALAEVSPHIWRRIVVAGDVPLVPRLSPQNRPYIITSKPANEVSRRTEVLFYYGPFVRATNSAGNCRMAEGDS
jgi:hypothetical protein